MSIRTLRFDHFRQPHHGGMHVMHLPDHGRSDAHDHLFHEIVFVEQGQATHVTAEGTRPLKAGDVIVIRPGIWHGYESPGRFSILNCLFSTDFLSRHAQLLAPVPGTFELYWRRPSRPQREGPVVLRSAGSTRAAILDRMQAILREETAQKPGWEVAAAGAMLEILVHSARLWLESTGTRVEPGSGRTDEAVLDTVVFLEHHFRQATPLATLARRVHLSPAHLSRNFTRRVGIGPVAFIHRLRCEEACRLLCWSDASITEIAGAVGYDDVAYFSRRFRKETGQSPRQYRNSRQQRQP